MSDAIRLGVIGCGRVSWERHHPALRRTPGIRTDAVCDLVEERARRIGALFGARAVFTDYRRMLEECPLDAVAVLTDTAAHAETGVAALEAGKHLFLEKPVALTRDEALRLIKARGESGPVAQVCFNLRWHRLIRQARELLRQGIVGRVKAIHSVYTHDRTGETAPDWHRKLALGGGVLLNEGVHHYDLWRYLLDLPVNEVHVRSRPSAVYEDETGTISAELEGGVLATGVFSFLSGPNSEVEVFGDKGRLLISLYRFDGLQFYSWRTYPGATADRLKRGARALRLLPGLLSDARAGGGFQASFAGCWRGFIEAVRTGAPVGCTLEDGLAALEVALASTASARTGAAERVERGASGALGGHV
ncbi:MAG: Gfo/Idh/MocA family oxidoreductase [Bryobacteraceae bacterium]|nr:Gfo/Idh/MocA family oxidoreductase [Bryobacteraceae bacterium]